MVPRQHRLRNQPPRKQLRVNLLSRDRNAGCDSTKVATTSRTHANRVSSTLVEPYCIEWGRCGPACKMVWGCRQQWRRLPDFVVSTLWFIGYQVHNIQIITTSSDRTIESQRNSITSFPNVQATCLCQSGSDNSSVNYLSDQYCISNEPSVGDTDATDDTHSAISLSTNMQPDGSSRSKSSSMTGLPVSLATASCRNKMSPAPNSRGKRSTDSEKRPLRSSSINSARHASRMAIQSPA